MKLIALLLTIVAVVQAKVQPPRAFNAALNVRGGGAIGPLDGDMAMKLSKTAATAYVAGSASKYITSQTGGTNTQLADFVTGELFQLHALITAVSAAMFSLGSSGFDSLQMLSVSSLLALVLRLDSGGFSVDTVKDNAIQAILALLLTFIAWVN